MTQSFSGLAIRLDLPILLTVLFTNYLQLFSSTHTSVLNVFQCAHVPAVVSTAPTTTQLSSAPCLLIFNGSKFYWVFNCCWCLFVRWYLCSLLTTITNKTTKMATTAIVCVLCVSSTNTQTSELQHPWSLSIP